MNLPIFAERTHFEKYKIGFTSAFTFALETGQSGFASFSTAQLQLQNQHPDCNRPMADAALVACPDCDLLQRIPEVPAGASVRCPRCDRELWRHKPDSLNRTFAMT